MLLSAPGAVSTACVAYLQQFFQSLADIEHAIVKATHKQAHLLVFAVLIVFSAWLRRRGHCSCRQVGDRFIGAEAAAMAGTSASMSGRVYGWLPGGIGAVPFSEDPVLHGAQGVAAAGSSAASHRSSCMHAWAPVLQLLPHLLAALNCGAPEVAVGALRTVTRIVRLRSYTNVPKRAWQAIGAASTLDASIGTLLPPLLRLCQFPDMVYSATALLVSRFIAGRAHGGTFMHRLDSGAAFPQVAPR